jgi:hypothetical protein
MTSVPSPSAIRRIEIFSHWVGFADPPSHSDKLTITNVGDRLIRQQALEATSDELAERVISRLLKALACPAIPRLDPAIFDVPPAVIDRHYNSYWTDDSPSHLIRIHCKEGRHITIRSDAQYAFMLPLKITDSATDAPFETFDPELSRALADLMPEGYLDRDRLAGRLRLLDWDREETERKESETAPVCEESEPTRRESVPSVEPVKASIEVNDEESEAKPNTENMQAEILRILFGEESAQDALEAEQSGRLSERLLKRNSLEAARDLLARGADPSIADDVGQTALMHAAFPPFDRKRFRLLVDAGADVDARRDGLTGLHLACAGGEAEAAAEWVRAGADSGARAPGGATPLMLGATWPRVVRTLLNESAEVNAVDDDGHGALVYAILRQCSVSADGQIEAVHAMIDAGGEVNLRDRAGISPVGHAKKVLAQALLEEEVILAFNPEADLTLGMEWNSRRLAEVIVGLLAAAGAIE